MIASGHSRKDVDGYTMAQGELFLKEASRLQKRHCALMAQSIVALAFDQETWKKLTEDL